MLDDRPLAVHFHYGPRHSGVGRYIDTVLTDRALPWRTLHLGAEALPQKRPARYRTFLFGVGLLLRQQSRVVFCHTLKAGVAGGVAKIVRPSTLLIYVGHGVRHAQKRHGLTGLKNHLAEIFVCAMARQVIHIREIDAADARQLLPRGLHYKIIVVPSRLSDIPDMGGQGAEP